MKPLGTAAVVLVLVGVAVHATVGIALVPALWVACVTPTLAATDLAEFRLPNGLTVPGLLVLGASIAAAAVAVAVGVRGSSADVVVAAAVVAVATSLLGWWIARSGAFGLGDVKLATLLAGSLALVDLSLLPLLAVVTGGSGGIAALAALAQARGRRWRTPTTATGAASLDWRATRIPFGPCLLLGYWAALGIAAAAG